MASNLASIHAAILAALRADSTFATVDDYPVDSEAWLRQLAAANAPSRLPALHVSSKADLDPYYTDGTALETDVWEVAGVYAYGKSNVSQYVTLRDAAMHDIFADSSTLALIDLFTEVGAEMGPQEDAYQRFIIRFKTTHEFQF